MLSNISAIPRVFNIDKVIHFQSFNIFDTSNQTPLNGRQKFFLLFWLIAVSLLWGAVRLHFVHRASLDPTIDANVPFIFCLIFILLLALPVLFMVKSHNSLLWLLGASVGGSSLLDFSLTPYINETAYLVFFITGLAYAIAKKASLVEASKNKLFKLLLGYLGICIVSLILNQFISPNVWQFKVGITQLVLYFSLVILLATFIRSDDADSNIFTSIVDGYAWAALAQIVITPLAVLFIFQIPFMSPNVGMPDLGIGNPLKSSLTSPSDASAYFAMSMPLLIWWVSAQKNKIILYSALGLLTFLPWLLILPGAQVARLIVIAVLGVCLFRQKLRIYAMPALLSCMLAFFYYQSFPDSAQTMRYKIGEFLSKGRLPVGVITTHLDSEDINIPLQSSEVITEINGNPLNASNENGSFKSPSLINEPPLTELKGMQLKFDSIIDSTPTISIEQQDPEKIASSHLEKINIREQILQEDALKGILVMLTKTALINKIFGFGIGTADYNTDKTHSSQIGLMKVMFETGISGLLLAGGLLLFLLSGLWKTRQAKLAEASDITFAAMAALLALSCSSFLFELQSWVFTMLICIIAIAVFHRQHTGNLEHAKNSV